MFVFLGTQMSRRAIVEEVMHMHGEAIEALPGVFFVALHDIDSKSPLELSEGAKTPLVQLDIQLSKEEPSQKECEAVRGQIPKRVLDALNSGELLIRGLQPETRKLKQSRAKTDAWKASLKPLMAGNNALVRVNPKEPRVRLAPGTQRPTSNFGGLIAGDNCTIDIEYDDVD